MSRVRENFVWGTLNADLNEAVTDGMTSAGLVDLPEVTAPDYAVVVLDPFGSAGRPEIVYVGAHTAADNVADDLVRGQEGTTDRQHLAGTPWVHSWIWSDFGNVEDDIADLQALTTALDGGDLSVFTTKGDILAATGPGVGVRVGQGGANDGSALVVDNAQSSGVKWGQVDDSGIADFAVIRQKLADQAVNENKLADASVYENHLADANVTTAKLGGLAVTTPKLDNNAVTTGKVANEAITEAKRAPILVVKCVDTSGVITTGGSGKSILFGDPSVVIDDGGFHSVVGAAYAKFTVPVGGAGLYAIRAAFEWDGSNTTGRRELILEKNGFNGSGTKISPVDRKAADTFSGGALNVSFLTETIERLADGDYITALAFQNSGVSLAWANAFFEMYRIAL